MTTTRIYFTELRIRWNKPGMDTRTILKWCKRVGIKVHRDGKEYHIYEEDLLTYEQNLKGMKKNDELAPLHVVRNDAQITSKRARNFLILAEK